MPTQVPVAIPTTVFPDGLFMYFEEDYHWEANLTVLPSNEVVGQIYVDGPRRKWKLTRRLPPQLSLDLRKFYKDHRGSADPFYVYVYSDSPYYSYDKTGNSTNGRHTARFDGVYSVHQTVGRSETTLMIIEIL